MEVILKLLFTFYLVNGCKGNVIITTQGYLEGVQNDGYVSYIGIPYAKVADRNGRFKVRLGRYDIRVNLYVNQKYDGKHYTCMNTEFKKGHI